jgi:ribosomal protein S12 methylthiotransferase
MISLGCPKNLVDSEVMLGLAQQSGHQLTQDPSGADVLIVNTCAFIDSAKQESVDAILEMAEHKKNGACQRLIVTGCMAERYRDELRAEIPEIDAVLGTGEVPDIIKAIGGTAAPRTPGVSPLTFFRMQGPSKEAESSVLGATPASLPVRLHAEPTRSHPAPVQSHSEPVRSHAAPTYLYDAETPRIFATPRHYAYVKVAEGCDYTCSFCIIPTLRGGYRSRTSASIVQEARALAARGVKELLLISQDTTFYGIDRGERGALARLLRELNGVDGLEWIRLLYLYPTTIGDDVLDAMAECEKVCKYIDLPLQHASNPVLKRMKRPGTRQKYDALLNRIRDRVPGVALRTTFIVGFPGETDADVDVLSDFVQDHNFDQLGVFTYSHEPGTSAFDLADDVPARSKKARRARLMSLQRRLVRRHQKARLGERTRVLVDGPAADHDLVLRARLATQAPDIDSLVYLTECDPSTLATGSLIDVEIVGARQYDLIARPLHR